MLNNRGIALLNAVVASLLMSTATYFFLASKNKLLSAGAEVRQIAVAQNYAAELLEVFTSLSSTELLVYLSEHPLGAATAFPPYKLCSHINLLDRNEGKIVNVDPLADVPVSVLQFNSDSKYKANRYYQVQVVEADTLRVNFHRCGDTALEMLNDPSKELKVSERLLVTVGMSWVPPKATLTTPRDIVLTTLLARH